MCTGTKIRRVSAHTLCVFTQLPHRRMKHKVNWLVCLLLPPKKTTARWLP